MVEPAELLENFCVLRVSFEDLFVRFLRRGIFLLQLVHVADLEPDVSLIERLRWRVENVLEILETTKFKIIRRKTRPWIPREPVGTFLAACTPYQGENKFRYFSRIADTF
jgi:hypothetical protein